MLQIIPTKNSSISFSSRSWALQSQILGHSSNVRGGSHLMVWSLNQNRFQLLPHRFCATILPEYHSGRPPLQTEGFTAVLVFAFLLRHVQSSSQHQEHQTLGARPYMGTSLTSPCSASYIGVVFSKRALPCICEDRNTAMTTARVVCGSQGSPLSGNSGRYKPFPVL